VSPERDVLLFLIDYAPLETWEADVLDMLREEAYYLAPQGQTKILNEGWASLTHSTLMTRRILADDEVIDYADHHSGTVAVHPGQLNPYKLGLELLRDIEERWDKGRFGREYEECDDRVKRAKWDLQLGLGRQKLFEVRRIYNDIGFIDQFLTEEFCERNKLFTYRWNPRTERYEIATRDFAAIKRQLLQSLTNFGQPIIAVENGNWWNRGELFLRHQHEGVDLKLDYARDTLANLYSLWKRPVHLETAFEGKGRVMLSYDGQAHIQKRLE
jgi:stage V sporulation protein R